VKQLLIPEKELIVRETNMEKSIPKGQKYEETYQFPKLTEEDIAANNKRKEKMLKNLAKLDKKEYVYIPSGTFDYHGSQTSVQSFYMQTAEVSNIEYKTFLFDLLINGRKEEFLKAKPEQDLWIKFFGDSLASMTNTYFSEEAFYDYPVVNISREGAELYCVWLTVEVRKYQGGKNTSNFNDIRIPLRSEWELAASESGKNMPFPWGGPYLRNANGCFLANFDTQQFNGLNAPASDTSTVACMDGALLTARTKTYNPNGYGIYNLSGNVAEMVYENYVSENGRLSKIGPGTAGGGWMSVEEELKINGTDQHEGEINAHPNIGFRVVMTYLNSGK
jgi:formylglycine-generating enzyme required for sulfatase activity